MKPAQYLLSTTILCLLMVMSVASDAQDRRGRGPGDHRFRRGMRGTLTVLLLRSKKVREELSLSDAQANKIDTLLRARRKKLSELISSPDGSRRSRERRQTIFAKREELDGKTIASAKALLEARQTKRFNEIALQIDGVRGLISDRSVAALKLSEEQVSGIRSLLKTQREAMRELRPVGPRGGDGKGKRRDRGRPKKGQGGRGRDKDAGVKSKKLLRETEVAALALLSPEQRETLTQLKGEPFEIDRRELFRRGSRRGEERSGKKKRQRPPLDAE